MPSEGPTYVDKHIHRFIAPSLLRRSQGRKTNTHLYQINLFWNGLPARARESARVDTHAHTYTQKHNTNHWIGIADSKKTFRIVLTLSCTPPPLTHTHEKKKRFTFLSLRPWLRTVCSSPLGLTELGPCGTLQRAQSAILIAFAMASHCLMQSLTLLMMALTSFSSPSAAPSIMMSLQLFVMTRCIATCNACRLPFRRLTSS